MGSVVCRIIKNAKKSQSRQSRAAQILLQTFEHF